MVGTPWLRSPPTGTEVPGLPPMRLRIRCLVLCLVTAAATVSPTAADARGRRGTPADPAAPAAAPVTLASLKTQANQAAAKYAAAQTVYARLGDQMEGLERQISGLEGKIAPLRDRITRQAVALYQGDVALAAVNRFE